MVSYFERSDWQAAVAGCHAMPCHLESKLAAIEGSGGGVSETRAFSTAFEC